MCELVKESTYKLLHYWFYHHLIECIILQIYPKTESTIYLLKQPSLLVLRLNFRQIILRS